MKKIITKTNMSRKKKKIEELEKKIKEKEEEAEAYKIIIGDRENKIELLSNSLRILYENLPRSEQIMGDLRISLDFNLKHGLNTEDFLKLADSHVQNKNLTGEQYLNLVWYYIQTVNKKERKE